MGQIIDPNLCAFYSKFKTVGEFMNEYEKQSFKPNLQYIVGQCRVWKDVCDYIQNNEQLFAQISEDDILDTLFHVYENYDPNPRDANFAYVLALVQETQDYFYAMYLRKTNGEKPKFQDLFKHNKNTNLLLRFFEQDKN